MEKSTRVRSLGSVVNDIKKEKYSFDSPLQREEGQWNSYGRSLLIDSILREYPFNPIYIVKKDKLEVIDGKQRLTTIYDYMNDKFALHKGIEPVEIDGKVYDIAKKKFSKLDEELQDKIKNCEETIYEFTNCTSEDIKEMFRRCNNGVKLNNKQLRVIRLTDELCDELYDLTTLPFMDKVFTKAQRKSATDRDCLIQAFMLMETSQDNEYLSFKTKDIDAFVDMNVINKEKIELLKQGINSIDKLFDAPLKLKTSSIPFVFYAIYRVTKDKKSINKLHDAIKKFIVSYETNDEYKEGLQSGTSSIESVRKRFDYWRKVIRTL